MGSMVKRGAEIAQVAEVARRTTTRQTLSRLYRQRAALDQQITAMERRMEAEREANGGRLKPERIEHGDESAYKRHVRQDIPFPEDEGGKPCGCRLAHAHYEARRVQRADDARNGVQLTVYDALREAEKESSRVVQG